ncbi:MAG: hypothetical protein KAX28_13985 [Candidatus Marinimicrobia bacterium]|nr:hypothetical protein [Candidatus Neomarinimicrobiota bacterium]
MNNKEADHIIINYKLHEGFYDLSEKPKTLTKIKYAKALKIQEYIASQVKNVDYLKKHCLIQYQKLVELSANYQIIIWKHWREIN